MTTRTPSWAQSRKWAEKLSNEQLACRGGGRHFWETTDRAIVRGYGYYLITQKCRCGLTKRIERDYLGVDFWSAIDYASAPEYLSDIGRVDRAAVRAVELTRYTVPDSIVNRPPHRTDFTPIPALRAARKRA
jgi:hypothetical protein